jgi:hypothetical protein
VDIVERQRISQCRLRRKKSVATKTERALSATPPVYLYVAHQIGDQVLGFLFSNPLFCSWRLSVPCPFSKSTRLSRLLCFHFARLYSLRFFNENVGIQKFKLFQHPLRRNKAPRGMDLFSPLGEETTSRTKLPVKYSLTKENCRGPQRIVSVISKG